jgi:AcrR family transcriptional regulator
MISRGLAATTTVEVQRLGGFSRGALLHYFPTREALLGAAISELLERNEAAIQEAQMQVDSSPDPIERAISVLRSAVVRPSFVVEMELWAASRTDPALREILRREERQARRELQRVLALVFGEDLVANPNYFIAVSLTVQFLRGLALSQLLRREPRANDKLIKYWTATVRLILAGKLSEFV